MTTFSTRIPSEDEPATRTVVLLPTGGEVVFDTLYWRERNGYLMFFIEDPETDARQDPFATFPPRGWVGVVEQ